MTRVTPAQRPISGGQERVREGDGARRLERDVRRLEKVGLRFHAAELRRLDEAVEERGDLGAALGARAVMILAADDETPEPALGGVVVQRDARVVEEARQAGSDSSF